MTPFCVGILVISLLGSCAYKLYLVNKDNQKFKEIVNNKDESLDFIQTLDNLYDRKL